MTYLHSLLYVGTDSQESPEYKRTILLSNIISITLSTLCLILTISYYFWYNWTIITTTIFLVSITFLLPLWLNKIRLPVVGKFLLCMLGPVTALSVSIYAKHHWYRYAQDYDYMNYRLLMLASCLFPAVLFSLKEKFRLWFALSIGLALLLAHDPLHYFFGVHYQPNGIRSKDYYFTNVVIVITYASLVGTVLFLKKISEESEAKAQSLINRLNATNSELEAKNKEIEAQNHEISAQTENLNISQSRLQSAYDVIEEQKNLLVKLNQDLSSELFEINKDLSATNEELIRHNNELRQFSYTVSHNLRGPVASLSGLISLLDTTDFTNDNHEIYGHIKTSIQKLEIVIKDLSQIIDIRNDIFHVRRKVNLATEVREILSGVKHEIDAHQIVVKIDVEKCPEVYSVKPMVHSILYNLITNAIKYKSNDRRPVIEIKCYNEDNFHVIEVKDNGLGINLQKHRQNMFKLYKRFHNHIEGKGMGLYLVKLQVESLGGRIEIESELNHYTLFKAYLAIPENVEEQELYRSAHARIFYDASINATGVVWNGPVSSEQYRTVFVKCLEFVKAYNTPNYIADLTNQGYITREDQLWMFQNILPEAARYGLRRIAAVKSEVADRGIEEYLRGIKENVSKLGMEQKFFDSFKDAIAWIKEENSVTTAALP